MLLVVVVATTSSSTRTNSSSSSTRTKRVTMASRDLTKKFVELRTQHRVSRSMIDRCSDVIPYHGRVPRWADGSIGRDRLAQHDPAGKLTSLDNAPTTLLQATRPRPTHSPKDSALSVSNASSVPGDTHLLGNARDLEKGGGPDWAAARSQLPPKWVDVVDKVRSGAWVSECGCGCVWGSIDREEPPWSNHPFPKTVARRWTTS